MANQSLLSFIPMTSAEMKARGWSELDILLVSGDAYVDHPSFGIPLLGRLLLREGYRVGIVAQPRFRNENEALEDLRRLGAPRLFVGIGAGVVDSMLNHYTANKKTRSDDMYSPGGKAGLRPDDATVVYARLARKAFPGVPLVFGGVEASLRRLAHYDYWQNRIRPSILFDLQDKTSATSQDLLVFGMGERPILKIAENLKKGHTTEQLRGERGIAYLTDKASARSLTPHLRLPSFEEVRDDKKKFARTAHLIELESNPYNAKMLVQLHGNKAVVINPPSLPLSSEEMDGLHEMPFTKQPHFSYSEKIPAAEMIRFSVQVNRGCFGGCSFCALTLHQGRFVQSRSEDSVLKELAALSSIEGFKGIVSDLGGPTANMYRLGCKTEAARKNCRKLSCLWPQICPHLVTDHSQQVRLLRKARAVKGVRKVLIASGLRYDLALKDPAYVREVITHHVGGHLKVAPEHTDSDVLRLMKKPSFDLFCEFKKEFEKVSREAGKEQYLVPYFISSFPGTTDEKMAQVHQWCKREGWKLQQVQSFIPTPMTLAAAMYWSGIDPASRQPLYVAREFAARKFQQALLQPHRQKNRELLKRRPR